MKPRKDVPPPVIISNRPTVGLPVTRPRRFLCFDCPAHPTFLSVEDFKDHLANGHQP